MIKEFIIENAYIIKNFLTYIKYIQKLIHFDAIVHYGTIIGTAYLAAHAHPNELNDSDDEFINPYISTVLFIIIYVSSITFVELEKMHII